MTTITPDSQDRGYWQVEPRNEADGSPDIYFKVIKPGCPAEMQSFKADIERALSTVRAIYARQNDTAKRHEAISKLTALAQLGLVGVSPAISEASSGLSLFQSDIVSREAGRIKNEYMVQLGKWAFFISALCAVAYILFSIWPSLPIVPVYRYRNILLVIVGCMAGAWASFASRKVVLAFDDLASLEEDKLDPPVRLVFAGVLTVILVLVFSTGFAQVVIGGFDAGKVLKSGSIALLFGTLAGLAEKALPAAIMQRANTFITRDDVK